VIFHGVFFVHIAVKRGNAILIKEKEAFLMDTITNVELSGFSELLTHEENIIRKYKCYAQTCEDPALKEMCEDMAQRHTKHYDAILQELQ